MAGAPWKKITVHSRLFMKGTFSMGKNTDRASTSMGRDITTTVIGRLIKKTVLEFITTRMGSIMENGRRILSMVKALWKWMTGPNIRELLSMDSLSKGLSNILTETNITVTYSKANAMDRVRIFPSRPNKGTRVSGKTAKSMAEVFLNAKIRDCLSSKRRLTPMFVFEWANRLDTKLHLQMEQRIRQRKYF